MFRRYLNDILLETIYHAKYREAIVVTVAIFSCALAVFSLFNIDEAWQYIVLVQRNITTAKRYTVFGQ